jgi:hypothetical protein
MTQSDDDKKEIPVYHGFGAFGESLDPNPDIDLAVVYPNIRELYPEVNIEEE